MKCGRSQLISPPHLLSRPIVVALFFPFSLQFIVRDRRSSRKTSPQPSSLSSLSVFPRHYLPLYFFLQASFTLCLSLSSKYGRFAIKHLQPHNGSTRRRNYSECVVQFVPNFMEANLWWWQQVQHVWSSREFLALHRCLRPLPPLNQGPNTLISNSLSQ